MSEDEVGTVRREDHELPGGEPGGYTLWVQMVTPPTRMHPDALWYRQAVWSTSPGNIGARSDEFDGEAAWPVDSWPVVARIPGTPAAQQQDAER